MNLLQYNDNSKIEFFNNPQLEVAENTIMQKDFDCKTSLLIICDVILVDLALPVLVLGARPQ